METFSPVAEDLKMQQNASQQHAQAIELLPSTCDVPNVHEVSRVLQKQCEFLCCHYIFISIVGINCFIYQEARDGKIYSYLNIFSHIRQISEELNGFFFLQVLILSPFLPPLHQCQRLEPLLDKVEDYQQFYYRLQFYQKQIMMLNTSTQCDFIIGLTYDHP